MPKQFIQDPTLPPGFSSDFRERFWSKVNITDTCWLWVAATNKGYGVIIKGGYQTHIEAHRASWIIHCGAIPEGKKVLHKCPGKANGKCVRPDHLYLGTQRDNLIDWINEVKAEQGAYKGAKLTPKQIREVRTRYQNGASQQLLASDYGVCQSTISKTVNFRVHDWIQ